MNDSRLVKQPPNLNVTLFPHQLKSIHDMEQLESTNTIYKKDYFKETKIGIQADITGYGKTLSMIGLILRDKMIWDLNVPYVLENITTESKGRIRKHVISRYDKLNTTFILVSQSIVFQWEQELQRTSLTFKSIVSNKCVEELIPENFDVILVTPSFYNKVVTTNSKLAWKRFIFDEPGHLRISGMREIIAGFNWFVTATPHAIINQHRNCKGSFMRDLFGRCDYFEEEEFINDITIKNSIEFINSSFSMPHTNHFTHHCHLQLFNVVKNIVSPTIKLMIEAGNIEGAIIALGGVRTSNIVDLIKAKKLDEIKELRIKMYLSRSHETHNDIDMRIHKIQEQIKDLDEKFENMLNDNCLICYDKIKNPILEPYCHNVFCGSCLLRWLERTNTCPCCRSTINPKNLVYIKSPATSNGEDANDANGDVDMIPLPKLMTKLEKVVDIIQSNPDGKYLIFSEYDATFYSICNVLTENDISFILLKGTAKTRDKMIESFKNGTINVMFLNSTNNCAGINLTDATDIILYHEMTASTEKQIIGRANRIGRKTELNVHHLTYTV